MILLGFNGPKRSGKDTAAAVIKQWAAARGAHVVARGFADELKLSAYRLLKPDATLEEALAWADAFKNRGKVTFDRVCSRFTKGDDGEWLPENIETVHVTGRTLFQRYGTESHREVFGDDFWVDRLLPADEVRRVRTLTKYEPEVRKYPQIAVITDVRFRNEAERIHTLGGRVWRVERPDLREEDGHLSEVPLPGHLVHLTLQNDSTLENFERAVETAANEYIHL